MKKKPKNNNFWKFLNIFLQDMPKILLGHEVMLLSNIIIALYCN